MLFMTIVDAADRLKVEQLYFKYRRLLYKEAYDILKDHPLAEDAVNESFVRIINNLHKIDMENERSTRGFLVLICKNVAINMYNEIHNLSEYDENLLNEDGGIDSNPENIAITKETYERIITAIEELPDLYKNIFLLRHSRHLSREEIARISGISVENVKKRLTRARHKILKTLEKEGAV